MKSVVSQVSKVTEETELRKLRSAREQVRAIFEMAGMLGATLSYTRILDAILDVASMGFQELGPVARQMVSVVLLYDKGGLSVVSSRRLTARDVQKTIQAKLAWWPRRSNPRRRCSPTTPDTIRNWPNSWLCMAASPCCVCRCGQVLRRMEPWWSPAASRHLYRRAYRDADRRMQPSNHRAAKRTALPELAARKERIVEIEENARKKVGA